MKKNKKVICIIPARGGSKGLRNKNILKLNGHPLIAYPISAAIKSNVCDAVFVSTDSKEIAKISKRYGASVPFLRNKKFAKDLTTTEDTLKNSLLSYEKYYNTHLKDNIWLSEKGKRLNRILLNCRSQCYDCHECERTFGIPDYDSSVNEIDAEERFARLSA